MNTASNPRAGRVLVLKCFALGLLHSFLMFVAFAGGGPSVMLAVVPIFVAALIVSRTSRFRPQLLASLSVWLGAVPFWAYTEWWISEIAAPGYPFLVLIQASWVGLFTLLVARAVARRPDWSLVWLLPLSWTGIEFFRGELFAHGYAWGLIAYPLIDSPSFAAPAVVGGVYFVSFLTALLPAAAIGGRVQKRGFPELVGIVSWAAIGLVSHFLLRPAVDADAKTVRIAAVQTNVPQSNKIGWTIEQEVEDFGRFTSLTEQAAAMRPDVIVWPETMMPGITLEPSALKELKEQGVFFTTRGPQGRERLDAGAFADQIKSLSARTGVPMLIGEDCREGLKVVSGPDGLDFRTTHRYNSVYLLRGGEITSSRYDKVRLTPFGETMPYISAVPGLQQQLLDLGAKGMKFDLDEGTGRTAFEIPFAEGGGSFRIVTPICFEVTVAPHVASLVVDRVGFGRAVRRADVIINVTNDGWFGSFDQARREHLQIARWRALELGTPIVRAANTGISCSIDGTGKVLVEGPQGASSPAMSEGVMETTVRLPGELTIYARIGDVMGWVSTLWLVRLVIAAIRKPRRA